MRTEWIELVHDVTGHTGRFPNKPNVIAARRAKGWRLASEPAAPSEPPASPTDANNDESSTKSTRKARSRAAETEE